jgi:hypothetical protein
MHLLVGQITNSPPHTSPPSLHSQNPPPSCSGNTSTSPFSPLPHTFPTERISPVTVSPEEIIKVQVLLKSVAYPGIFSGGGSTNSVKNRGQRERGSGAIAP